MLKIERFVNRVPDVKVNLVFNYNNTTRRQLVKNKSERIVPSDVGVYEIPCQDCNLKYFGESGRGLSIRIREHKRSYDSLAMNNVLVKHAWEKDHRINWNNAKILFNSKEVGVRRIVEGAAINLGLSMDGNKSFTQEDKFTNYIICDKYIKNFFNFNVQNAVPDATVAS